MSEEFFRPHDMPADLMLKLDAAHADITRLKDENEVLMRDKQTLLGVNRELCAVSDELTERNQNLAHENDQLKQELAAAVQARDEVRRQLAQAVNQSLGGSPPKSSSHNRSWEDMIE
jgi:hypothetical protein